MWSSYFGAILLSATVFASDVIDLSDTDFDVKIQDEDIMLIEFFAPW